MELLVAERPFVALGEIAFAAETLRTLEPVLGREDLRLPFIGAVMHGIDQRFLFHHEPDTGDIQDTGGSEGGRAKASLIGKVDKTFRHQP